MWYQILHQPQLVNWSLRTHFAHELARRFQRVVKWLPRSISPLLEVELVLVRDDIFANDWPLNVVTTAT
jgi:hypothetical protein